MCVLRKRTVKSLLKRYNIGGFLFIFWKCSKEESPRKGAVSEETTRTDRRKETPRSNRKRQAAHFFLVFSV